MGLFKKIKDPVEGTAQVVAASAMPHEASAGRCTIHLVVSLPGREPYPTEITKIVKVKRWPFGGMQIPVTVDANDPGRMELHWDRVPTREEIARQQTQQLAAGMTGGGPGAPVDPGQLLDSLGLGGLLGQGGADGGPTIVVDGQVVAGDPGRVDEAVARARAADTGDAAGSVDDDRLAALERLVALRDAGALSDEEFEAEKARVLGR